LPPINVFAYGGLTGRRDDEPGTDGRLRKDRDEGARPGDGVPRRGDFAVGEFRLIARGDEVGELTRCVPP